MKWDNDLQNWFQPYNFFSFLFFKSHFLKKQISYDMINFVISAGKTCEIYVKSFDHICAPWSLEFSLHFSFSQRETACFWDVCCSDLVNLLWSGSSLIKKEGKVKGPYFSIYERFFIFITAQFKVNESRYIALFAFSLSIKKLFSIDCVNTYLFSISFSIYFTRWERMGLPHIAYIIVH